MEETTRIENKLQLTPELDIEKEVIAFLNYKEGGIIYIGIDKEDRITLMASVKTSDHASDHASVQVKKTDSCTRR